MSVQSRSCSLPNPGTTLDTALTLCFAGTESGVVIIQDVGMSSGTASVTTNGFDG